ncbi:hypothetical protein GOV04_01000 [Candidatus Woesearchaeota archaeon]|nr:hypothetical protein [Candidatus Woesearchaeota archaeon]
MTYERYVRTTIMYGVIALIGFFGFLYFAFTNDWFLAVISLAMLIVSLDNFFCGTRLSGATGKTCNHYVMPPFLKKKK